MGLLLLIIKHITNVNYISAVHSNGRTLCESSGLVMVVPDSGMVITYTPMILMSKESTEERFLVIFNNFNEKINANYICTRHSFTILRKQQQNCKTGLTPVKPHTFLPSNAKKGIVIDSPLWAGSRLLQELLLGKAERRRSKDYTLLESTLRSLSRFMELCLKGSSAETK